MANAAVTISGSTTNAGGVSLQVGPIVMTSSTPIGSNLEQVLSSGDNSFTIPSGTTLIIVQLPLTNAVVTKLVGATSGASTGTALLAAGGVALFQPAASQTTFVLNAASAHTAGQYTTITFI